MPAQRCEQPGTAALPASNAPVGGALCGLPPNACIYTVSMDSPQAQARWQESVGVLHQALSAHRSEQFGQEYGVWLKEWRLLQRAVFVLARNAHILYAECVADQLREPDYAAAMQAVELAIGD